MRRVLVVLGVIGCSDVAFAAKRIKGWKDGCPPYFAPESAHRLELPTKEPSNGDDDPPLRGGSSSFGVQADPDSSLGPSRVAIHNTYRSLTGAASFITSRGIVHFALTSGPTFTVSYAGSIPSPLYSSPSTFKHGGNLQAYLGYRHAFYILGDAVRSGVAFRIGGGSSFGTAGNSFMPGAQRNIEELNQLAILSPFSSQTFGFDRPVTGTLEWRAELIGCHAPFLQIRVDASRWRTQHQGESEEPPPPILHPVIWAIPMSISVGGYASPDVGLAFTAGVELRSPRSEWLGGRYVTRLSSLLEFRWPSAGRLHTIVRGSAFTGDLTGWESGVDLAWQFGSSGVLE